jgi:hypothetical protein
MRKRPSSAMAGLAILAMGIIISCSQPNPEMKYKIIYNGNEHTGGTVPVDSNSYSAGDEVIILENRQNLIKTGKRYSGWNTRAEGNGTDYFPGDILTFDSSDIVLYAKWDPPLEVSVTISIPGDGTITFPSTDIEVLKGEPLVIAVNETTYSLYDWYLDGLKIEGELSSVEINTTNLFAGIHEIMIIVTNTEGVCSSFNYRFTVIN